MTLLKQAGHCLTFAIRSLCVLSVGAGMFVWGAAPETRPHLLVATGFSFALHGSPGIGDLDGDNRADIAYARPQGRVNGAYRYQVEVVLSAQSGAAFAVDSSVAGGLHISTRDVDGDRDLDLVITSAFGGRRVGVWINDGHGQFTQGVADNYPLSIWQEPDRTWETPDRPHLPPVAFVIPAGNSSIETRRLAIPFPANTEQSLHAVRKAYCHKSLNSGSPFRAPPLS